jgi:hypothetical protein
MTTIKKAPRSLVSLKLPTVVGLLISFARALVQALTGNPSFPNPTPTLGALSAAINDLETAQTAALTRVKGAVEVRNEKHAALVKLLADLRAYVQTVANAGLPEHAAAIIQSAGMNVKKTSARKPRVFAAIQGSVSGSVKLVAPFAGPRAAYDWEWSTDGGKTWQLAPSTMQARTGMIGLTPGSTVLFRYRAVTKTGETDWSEPTSFIVK